VKPVYPINPVGPVSPFAPIVSNDTLNTEPIAGELIFPDKYVTPNAQYVKKFTIESTAYISSTSVSILIRCIKLPTPILE
jgi:hypothetical protein